jgi:uncharacterized membrane protein YfcA
MDLRASWKPSAVPFASFALLSRPSRPVPAPDPAPGILGAHGSAAPRRRVAFFLAGLVKGISGMGLPTVAIGLLGVVMTPATAAALLVIPSLVTNVAQCFGKSFAASRRCCGRCGSASCWARCSRRSPRCPPPAHRRASGSGWCCCSTAPTAWRGPRTTCLPRGWMLLVAFLVGCGTGFMAAATGVFFFPMVVFLQMLDFDKDEMVQALGISFVVGTVSLAGSLGWGVSWNAAWSVAGVLALVFAFAGMAMGARVRDRIPATTFRKLLFIVFGILGAVMIGKEVV